MPMTALDYLAIRGLPTDGNEVFVGIAPTTTADVGDVTVTVQTETPVLPAPRTRISDDDDIAAALWEAQTTLLNRQIDYLKNVQREMQTKWEDIPSKLKERTVKETLLEEFAAWLAEKVATYFWGPTAGQLARMGVALIATAVRLLRTLYNEADALCGAMMAECEALKLIEQSRENYELRSAVYTQHDVTISNLLRDITTTERIIETHTSGSEDLNEQMTRLNETMELIQAEDNIVQCPHSGDCLYTKSLVRDSSSGEED